MNLSAGSLLDERFRLERTAHQSRRSLWLATDIERDEEVVIKLLQPERIGDDDEVRRRFLREGTAGMRVVSPNVARVLCRGITRQGVPYLVMEKLVGETLAARLMRKEPLSSAEVAEIIRQTAIGLSAAHEAGIVHRDIEPGNLFLARTDKGVVVKILDFGVAKLDAQEEAKLTRPGQMLGAPPYASPESVRGRRPAATDDLWSLAVVAYQGLTRRVPFNGETFGATYVAIVKRKYTPVRELRDDLHEGVHMFFEQAFAPSTAERFVTATALARALARALDVEDDELEAATWTLVGQVSPFKPRHTANPIPLEIESDSAWSRRRAPRAELVLTHLLAAILGSALTHLL